MSGPKPMLAKPVRMARPASYAAIARPQGKSMLKPGSEVLFPQAGNQAGLAQIERQRQANTSLTPQAMAGIANDLETVVGLLRQQWLDSDDEQAVVDVVRRWAAADRRLPRGSGTPHLDRFLLLCKTRAYSRATGRSGFMDQSNLVYDDLFRELEDDRLQAFKSLAALSQMYSGEPGAAAEPANFWLTMGKKEAVGVWGILKGMGTSVAGMSDAGAWAVTKQLRVAGIDVADPSSAAAWLAKQYDISGDAMFGREEWSNGEELFLGMSTAEFATHGGEGIWSLVMMGKGGGAGWSQTVEKFIGLSSNLMVVENSAKEIVAILEAQQTTRGSIDVGLLMQNPAFHQALLRLVANAFGAVAGDSKKVQRISAMLEGAQLAPIVGQLVEIGTSAASFEDKKKRAGPVLMELIKQAIATGGAARAAKHAAVDPKAAGPDGTPPQASKTKDHISGKTDQEAEPVAKRSPEPPEVVKPKAVPPRKAVDPAPKAETEVLAPKVEPAPERMAALPPKVASEASPPLEPTHPEAAQAVGSELVNRSPRPVQAQLEPAADITKVPIGSHPHTEILGRESGIDLAFTFPMAAQSELPTSTAPQAKPQAGVDALVDRPLSPHQQQQLDLGFTGNLFGTRDSTSSSAADSTVPEPHVLALLESQAAVFAEASRPQPHAPEPNASIAAAQNDGVRQGAAHRDPAEQSGGVVTLDLPQSVVEPTGPVQGPNPQTPASAETLRMGMGLQDPAPIADVTTRFELLPDLVPFELPSVSNRNAAVKETIGGQPRAAPTLEAPIAPKQTAPVKKTIGGQTRTAGTVEQMNGSKQDVPTKKTIGIPRGDTSTTDRPNAGIPGLELDFGPRVWQTEAQEPSPVHLQADLEDGVSSDLSHAGGVPADEIDFQMRDLGPSPDISKIKEYRGRRTINEVVPRAAQVHGQPSDEQSGTHRRTGIDYNSLNAAEIAQGLRVNYDAIAGRPNQIEYQVDPGSTQREVQTDRGFARDSSTLGAQATDADYTNTGYDKGHLAQREAFKGDGHVERAADLMTNVVPMTVALNRGEGSPWRAAEAETIRWADQYGGVQVKVTPIYDANPPKLPSGIPIPKAIHRKVVAADGQVLQDLTFLNR